MPVKKLQRTDQMIKNVIGHVIKCKGAVELLMVTGHGGYETLEKVFFICPGVHGKEVYMSFRACKNLKVVLERFPRKMQSEEQESTVAVNRANSEAEMSKNG